MANSIRRWSLSSFKRIRFHSTLSDAAIAALNANSSGLAYQNANVEKSDLSQTLLSPKSMLTDNFGRFHNYLRISLTERCNLRCLYCMPEEGIDLTPNKDVLTNNELARLARIFVEDGVTKIRLTGGEPTLRRDLVEFFQQLDTLRPNSPEGLKLDSGKIVPGLRSIGMTTNAITLNRHLDKLCQRGLDAINISLDTLNEHRFELLTRRNGFKKVMKGLEASLRQDKLAVKLNAVIMRGINHDELLDFVDLTKDNDLEVRFIEYMPFDGNRWNEKKMISYQEMLRVIRAKYPHFHRRDDLPNETAKTFSVEGFEGRVGFITSMSDHFCSTCNRLRLTADGNLKVCLFGNDEISLRDLMRNGASDDELRAMIDIAVNAKKEKHAGMNVLAVSKNRPMIKIGG